MAATTIGPYSGKATETRSMKGTVLLEPPAPSTPTVTIWRAR